jgi:hypothetical protein
LISGFKVTWRSNWLMDSVATQSCFHSYVSIIGLYPCILASTPSPGTYPLCSCDVAKYLVSVPSQPFPPRIFRVLPPQFSHSSSTRENFLNITPSIIYLVPLESPRQGESIGGYYILKFLVLVKL